jgi:hypothetical protein
MRSTLQLFAHVHNERARCPAVRALPFGVTGSEWTAGPFARALRKSSNAKRVERSLRVRTEQDFGGAIGARLNALHTAAIRPLS